MDRFGARLVLILASVAACGDEAPGGGGRLDAGSGRLDALALGGDGGAVDLGFDDAGNAVSPDLGFDDAGNAVSPDLGFDDAGNAVSPDLGFDDAGNAVGPDLGFDDAGNAVGPDLGFDDRGNPVQPDGGNPVQADGGTNPTGDGGSGDGGDGGPGPTTDGGPLGVPLSQFCSGSGAVVDIGAGGQCSGNVAQQTFRFALCTCDGVTLQSNLGVDAFDSRLGPYGAPTPMGPNVREDGHVGVNGQLAIGGMLDVLGSVFVSGGGFSVGQRSSVSVNVYASGDAVQTNSFTDVGRNMFVDGNVVGRYDITENLYVPAMSTVDPRTTANLGGMVVRGAIPSITPCPCGPTEILDVQSFVDFGQTFNDNATTGVLTSTTWSTGTGPDVIELPCGRYYLTQVLHPRGITIRAQDRTVLYVDGDVALGGGLRLELAQGAEIDLFIAGSLTLQAASRLGDETTPSAVRTYVGGTAPIVLNASSVFGGNLYAPRAPVLFNASADLYGALFAQSAAFSGAAEIHYDSAIRAAGQACTDGGISDGGPRDAGDGGAPRDAGDSGPAPDAGDGGVRDGGPAPDASDAGPRDAAPAPDVSTTPDAGTGCTQCFGCGQQQACLFPPDASVGVCGPCQSDLDCCPTEICVMGQCRPTL